MLRQLFHMEQFLHFHEFYVLKSQIFIKDTSCLFHVEQRKTPA